MEGGGEILEIGDWVGSGSGVGAGRGGCMLDHRGAEGDEAAELFGVLM